MKVSFYLLFVGFWLPSLACAGGAGTTSANFLKLRTSPRAIGMGEAHVAVANDSYATYWNPAGMAQLKVPEVGFTHLDYVESIRQQYVTFVLPQPKMKRSYGLSITYLSVGDFQGYDAVGTATSKISASDMAIGFSYAQSFFVDERLGSSLMVGGTGKWIREKLDTVSASALAIDGGVLYTPGKRYGDFVSGFKTGLVIKNVGSAMKYDQDSFDLPRVLAAGISYTNDWRGHPLTIAFDLQKPQAGSHSFSMGGEIDVTSFWVVRAGYTTESDLGNGFRAGAGFRVKAVQIDYAFAGVGAFGSAHRIGLTYQFGTKTPDPLFVANEWYRKGVLDFERQRFTDALIKFNKALEIDPHHPDALTMMNKTYEELKTKTLQP